MFRPLARSHRRSHRRGTSFILIVVVSLSLFAVVGTAFALYAMREHRLALARKDAEGGGSSAPLKAPDPTDTINRFFGSLIFDTGDDAASDITNSLRGHSLARSMYGRDVYAQNQGQALTTPWAGVGVFHEDSGTYGIPGLTGDRARFINHTSVMIVLNNGTSTPLLLDPEYNSHRGVVAAGVPVFDPTLRTYIGKHAGYSFPDLKDFFAGSLDPATGQVLQQSFHRDWLFGTLDPNNPNWTSPQGLLMTLRPRPLEHPQFPRVPPNGDNPVTYTGDVQNWPGGVGPQRNDSLWMNIGLPVITLPGNRKVQPLVAALIIPTDGVFDASSHGNTYGVFPQPMPNPPTRGHLSHAGYGPWEVNMGAALGAEADSVVGGRGLGLQQRNGNANRAYDPYTATRPLPTNAPVAWNTTPVTFAYPSGNSISGVPTFTGFQTTNPTPPPPGSNAAEPNHPSLFNPGEWASMPPLSAFRTFPLGDIKRMNRYAFTPDWYSQSDVAPYSQTWLKGTYGFTFNTGAIPPSSPYGYRRDPAHATRALVNTRSFDLDRPKLVPNFANRDANPLNMPVGATKPTGLSPGQYPTPPYARGTLVSDFATDTPAGANRMVNALAALGSVNLNRPLADYRTNLNAPLSDKNPDATTLAGQTQLNLANADRQQLARDIFVRLAAATGASLSVNMTPQVYPAYQYSVPAAVVTGTTQYNALRYLAQLSANIVDYIDNDDISTPFAWNPNAPTDVVYGVEKSRLVINEAYSEIVNDPGDPVVDTNTPPAVPTKPAQVRVWAELLNPTTSLNAAGPLGDGTVPLSAYQIQIRRAYRQTKTVLPTDVDAGPNVQNDYLFNNPANTTGGFEPSAGAPDATVSLAGGVVTAVAPNNSQYAPAPAKPTANGIVLVGPTVAAKAGSEEFVPAGAVWANVVTPGAMGKATASTAMGYQFDLPPANSTFSDPEFKRHILLLRRLANPYMGYNAATNPYITVDVMDYVPAFDAVHRGSINVKDRKARDATTPNPTGYDPVNDPAPAANRFSVGKVQPYAGRSVATMTPGPNTTTAPYGYNQYSFPTSMVKPQTTANGGQPSHTFGRLNYTGGGTGPGGAPNGSTYVAGITPSLADPVSGKAETIMTPFDWMVHMDRPLVNQIELFQVRDTPPHRVTDQFITGPTGVAPGINYEAGYARWRFTYDGLARGLEYLTVQPYTAGVPHGGRVPGKININAIPDKRVLTGLMDPQAGNLFDTNFVTNNAWNRWMASRSGVTQRTLADGTPVDTTAAPGASVFDTNAAGGNRPFLSAGAPAVDPNSSFAFGATGIDPAGNPVPNRPADYTMFRADGNPTPHLFVGPPAPSYTQAEPARKIMNNITPVSHTYLVFVTIGYFDVVGTVNLGGGVTTPQLGAEAYLSVPGDMRAKVVAVVDMSSMALDPQANTPANGPQFFTSLESTAYANNPTLNISYSSYAAAATAGNPNRVWVAGYRPDLGDIGDIEIMAGTQLVLGYGIEQQVVTVASVVGQGPVAGQVQLAVTPNVAPFRTAWAGSSVSNVRPGYAGPQPNFTYSDPRYKPVLPYLERLR